MFDPGRRKFCAGVAAAAVGSFAPVGAVRRASAAGDRMIQRAIPASGETVPVIGMGTSGTFDVGADAESRAPLREVLQVFYDAGASLIDTSPMYGRAEAVTGDLVAELDRAEGTFFATKVWTTGREAGLDQIEASMRLLQTEQLDLLQIHNLVDWRTHARTLAQLADEDRIRYDGITHYTVGSHGDLEAVLRERKFDFVQFNYSIATRAAEERLLPFCADQGIAVLINRPFEDGALFAKVRGRPLPDWATEIDCSSWAQVFLKFVLSHPAVTCVIPATSKEKHMRDNLQAGFGRLPDAALRERMAADVAKL
jgi:aryl-alcohol dehydrogenase-like predicted oxidoreductase